MAQVAIAWILSKPGVSAPVVGTTSLANLEDILSMSFWFLRTFYSQPCSVLEGAQVKLTDEEIKYLEEPYKPTTIFGHQ